MEIAFFFGGITRTACDQLTSSGTASGSLRTASAICLSFKASTAAQSVLPLRRSPHFLVIIRSFFISSCAASRDDPKGVSAPREHDGDDAAFRFTNCYPALLHVSVRAAEQARAVEDLDGFVEVDAMF